MLYVSRQKLPGKHFRRKFSQSQALLDCERDFFQILVKIFQQGSQPCFVNIEGTILRRKKFPKNCKFQIIWSLSKKFVDFRLQKSRQVRQNCIPCEQGNTWTKTRSEEKDCMSNNLVSGKFFRLLPNFRQEGCQNCILNNRRINLIKHVWRKNNYFYHFGFRTKFFLLLTFWWEKFSLLCEVCVLITAPKGSPFWSRCYTMKFIKLFHALHFGKGVFLLYDVLSIVALLDKNCPFVQKHSGFLANFFDRSFYMRFVTFAF